MTSQIKQICRIPGRLDGKIALITGANIGCGLELTGELARRGAKVIMACRDEIKAHLGRETLVLRMGEQSEGGWMQSPAGNEATTKFTPIKYSQLIIELVDLSSLASIRVFAGKIRQEYQKLDILIHNAGVMATNYMETGDGFEYQIAVNHLAPVLLTDLLLPLLYRAAPARMIVIASNLYKQGKITENLHIRREDYRPFTAYNQSKLANILFVREFHEKVDSTKVIAMAVHPGAVRSELSMNNQNQFQVFLRANGISSWEGAQTALYCVLIPSPVGGGFYSNCTYEDVTEEVKSLSLTRRVWSLSRKLVGLPEV